MSEPLRMVLEFNGQRLLTQDVGVGAVINVVDQGQSHEATAGEWIGWRNVPGLVVHYEPCGELRPQRLVASVLEGRSSDERAGEGES